MAGGWRTLKDTRETGRCGAYCQLLDQQTRQGLKAHQAQPIAACHDTWRLAWHRSCLLSSISSCILEPTGSMTTRQRVRLTPSHTRVGRISRERYHEATRERYATTRLRDIATERFLWEIAMRDIFRNQMRQSVTGALIEKNQGHLTSVARRERVPSTCLSVLWYHSDTGVWRGVTGDGEKQRWPLKRWWIRLWRCYNVVAVSPIGC